jgi:hypothetical protein
MQNTLCCALKPSAQEEACCDVSWLGLVMSACQVSSLTSGGGGPGGSGALFQPLDSCSITQQKQCCVHSTPFPSLRSHLVSGGPGLPSQTSGLGERAAHTCSLCLWKCTEVRVRRGQMSGQPRESGWWGGAACTGPWRAARPVGRAMGE